MRIEDIMNTPVLITQRNVKVGHLKDTFSRKGVNAVPVLEEDGTISGIVSSSDLARCHDESQLAEDIMTNRVHIVLKNNRAKDAAGTMVKHGVHHLVVMEDGNVVGMLSSMDIVKIYAEE